MSYYSPFSGPFSVYPVPSPPVIVTEPDTDDTIDIGSASKRYKTSYIVDMISTTTETGTLTATTVNTAGLSATTGTITTLTATTVNTTGLAATTINLNGTDLTTELSTVVSCTHPTVVTDHVVVWQTGSSPFLVKDTGIVSNNVVQTDGSVISLHHIPHQTLNGTQLVVQDSGLSSTSVVIGSGATTAGHLASFSNTTATGIDDSTIDEATVVINTGTSTTGNVAVFTDGSGKIIQDGGPLPTPIPPTVQAIFSLNLANPVTVTNTTAYSTVLAPGLGSLTIAPNQTQAGSMFLIYGSSRANINAATSVTFSLTIDNQQTGPTYTSAGGAGGLQFNHEIRLFLDAAETTAFLDWIISSPAFTPPIVFQVPHPASWDSTVSHVLDFQVQWSIADPGNQISNQSFLIQQSF